METITIHNPFNLFPEVQKVVDEWAGNRKVTDFGPWTKPYHLASVAVDKQCKSALPTTCCDLNYQFPDNYYEFVYCRHLLEDLHSPYTVLEGFKRCAMRGYIEVPSVMQELTIDVDGRFKGANFRGHIHHRWYCWISGSTIYMLPKYGLPLNFDTFINTKYDLNNYLLFNGWELQYKIYELDVDYDLKSYLSILSEGVRLGLKNSEEMEKLCS